MALRCSMHRRRIHWPSWLFLASVPLALVALAILVGVFGRG